MSSVPWLLLAGVGWIRLGRMLLYLLAGCCLVYGCVVLLQDVVGVLRPDGARCETDSNCLSLCHHPPLRHRAGRPKVGYCSSDCGRSGHCGFGVCRRVAEGWRCVSEPRRDVGEECGEDTECTSERCVGLHARDGDWIEPAKARSEDFRGGFCSQVCQDLWDCPRATECAKLSPSGPRLCVPTIVRIRSL